jgi:hypothetical protein
MEKGEREMQRKMEAATRSMELREMHAAEGGDGAISWADGRWRVAWMDENEMCVECVVGKG